MRRFIYTALFLFVASCKQEESGLELKIPDALNTIWRYEVRKLSTDTTLIGILDVTNVALENFEGRSGVLTQKREMQLDSLQNTPQAVIQSSVHFQNAGAEILHYADNPFAAFDEMFRKDVFDTLAAKQTEGEPYQSFDEFVPGWTAPFRFTESARFSYTVVPKKKYFIKFRYDRDTLAGFVEVSAFALFSGLERISLPFEESTVAYKMKTTLEMEFSLVKNGTQSLGLFRKTSVQTSWFHPKYGLVNRVREPFKLYIPDYPTRYPIISFPGESWLLILYFAGLNPVAS